MSRQDEHIKPFADGPDGDADLTEEQLLAYLEGRLSADEAHAVERLLAADAAGTDALDGLTALGAAETRRMRSAVHESLRGKLRSNRARRRGVPDQRWIWLAVGLVLLLAVAAYLVLRYTRR